MARYWKGRTTKMLEEVMTRSGRVCVIGFNDFEKLRLTKMLVEMGMDRAGPAGHLRHPDKELEVRVVGPSEVERLRGIIFDEHFIDHAVYEHTSTRQWDAIQRLLTYTGART